ncbi:hypothetical protein [Paraglaciecola sp. 20A4]|uniref:hypothetical protein n=1 Tax=Paraglaciecola sp. 20A4 TaxID=2687288 RepID=UPI0014083B3A|nr:hypothetical protein [Paraglaciecola sp. 20A4]
MHIFKISIGFLGIVFVASWATPQISQNQNNRWLLIDDFEQTDSLDHWTKADTKNDTSPHITNPQITERRTGLNTQLKLSVNAPMTDKVANNYMLKKPAGEGIVGNRKALTFKALPESVDVGDTYTFYTRINVEYFPNNHAFGLSNLGPEDIKRHDYNAFEATLRITDKAESNGHKNNGALMVKVADGYDNVKNFSAKSDAKPLVAGVWYEIWYVVNNAEVQYGGQTYDVYLKGGDEFPEQTLVYRGAAFRMQRALPLTYFLMNCNTGPIAQPYGNGGLRYDDLYMVKGVSLVTP